MMLRRRTVMRRRGPTVNIGVGVKTGGVSPIMLLVALALGALIVLVAQRVKGDAS